MTPPEKTVLTTAQRLHIAYADLGGTTATARPQDAVSGNNVNLDIIKNQLLLSIQPLFSNEDS